MCDYMQHCFIKRYKKVSLFPIEILLTYIINHTMCDWLYQLRHRSDLCLRALKKIIWSNFHFIVDEKVKILHFHDEDKSWWSSIVYHSVANANRYLYILDLILPELIIDCFEKPLFLGFLIDFFCNLRWVLHLKWS